MECHRWCEWYVGHEYLWSGTGNSIYIQSDRIWSAWKQRCGTGKRNHTSYKGRWQQSGDHGTKSKAGNIQSGDSCFGNGKRWLRNPKDFIPDFRWRSGLAYTGSKRIWYTTDDCYSGMYTYGQRPWRWNDLFPCSRRRFLRTWKWDWGESTIYPVQYWPYSAESTGNQ